MRLFLAMLCAAAGFTVQWREQWGPRLPDPVVWLPQRSWFHNYKNLWTKTLRADCEWWGKFLAFVIVLQFVVICVLTL